MNDPIPEMALAIALNLQFDPDTLRVIPSSTADAARAALEAYRKAAALMDAPLTADDAVAMIKEKGALMFAPYGLLPRDVEQPLGAVVVSFDNGGLGIDVCLSALEVRMNAAPKRMASLVEHRLNNAYSTFQANGGLCG